jgi:hypothetical protein
MISKSKDVEYTNIDLELLFNAIINDGGKIKDLFDNAKTLDYANI